VYGAENALMKTVTQEINKVRTLQQYFQRIERRCVIKAIVTEEFSHFRRADASIYLQDDVFSVCVHELEMYYISRQLSSEEKKWCDYEISCL
jgi:hypothetical protein